MGRRGGRPGQEGEWAGAARNRRRWGDWEKCAACASTRRSGLPQGRGGGRARRRRVRVAGCCAAGSRLSPPWRVEEAEAVLGALPFLSLRPPPPASPLVLRGLSDARLSRPDMARGQQKIQSQQKNAKKQAGQKKKQGHDQKAAAKAALIYTCTVCRTQMPDPKTFKQHFESKHPKTPLPPELADVQA
ncbi:zinc finger protein 706 [Ovis canadensis]|uniref:zinc finger protein 706 n=1 Tax=Ovis canadensis TaxID=37174 RepID=UPI0037522248